jgi:hypothetical protein
MTMRSNLCAALAAAAALAVPAAADAATVTYDGSTLHYKAAPGETNLLSLQKSDSGRLLLVEAFGVTLDDQTAGHCVPGYDTYILDCEMPAAVDADLDDGNDRGSVSFDFPAGFHATIHGGDGKDRLDNANNVNPVTFDGGAGDDEITGGEAPDTIQGGAGEDTINGRGAGDDIDAGDGNDSVVGDGYNVDPASDVIDGGPGIDKIETDWSDPTDSAPPLVNVTLGSGADDGRPGEGDDVRNIEQLYVYSAGSYTGSDGPDDIQVRQVDKPSTLKGGAGDDSLDASDGADDLDGGTGNDVVDGGFGDDHIVGGPGADQLHGDTPEGECGVVYCKLPFGNDTIEARDGERDSIDCGVGEDKVIADAVDVVAGDCETVDRPADNGSGGGGNGNGNGGNAGGGGGSGHVAVCVVPRVRGLSQSKATKKLAKAGCKVKVKKARSRSVVRGYVIRANRKAGAKVKRGTKVTITVSRGR